jgi:hypothetical protein
MRTPKPIHIHNPAQGLDGQARVRGGRQRAAAQVNGHLAAPLGQAEVDAQRLVQGAAELRALAQQPPEDEVADLAAIDERLGS